jgi:uncharacterized cupredoxin-like copper-binding protein
MSEYKEQKQVLHRNVVRVLAGIGLVLSLSACGGGGSGAGANRISVQGLDTFRFAPEAITATAGQQTTIALANVGVLEHSLVIDELGVKIGPLQANQTGEQTFTPNAAGQYVFYCDIPGHFEAGMAGTITVNQ